jgi:predicted DCC family thiol-disulfide oxidoreductase YuxK
MKPGLRVASPPQRPLVIYDGDCGFCKFWIRKWANKTEGRVDYVISQDPTIPKRFPEIPRQEMDRAVQLIESDGAVYSGAEASFRAIGFNPAHRRWQGLYDRFSWFAWGSETAYRIIAGNRSFFSRLTRIFRDMRK